MRGFASFLGLEGYVNTPIRPGDQYLDIAVVAKLDDELVEVISVERNSDGSHAVRLGARGLFGTTATSHPDGTELMPVDSWPGVVARPGPRPGLSKLNQRIAKSWRNPSDVDGFVG